MTPKHAACFSFLLALFISLPVFAQLQQRYLDTSENLYGSGQYAKALKYAEKARSIIERDSGTNSHAYARVADQSMGMIHEKLGDVRQALHWYRLAIDGYTRLGDTLTYDYGEAAANLGNLFYQLGQPDEAESHLLHSRRAFRAVSVTTISYAGATNNLANTYSYVGKYPEAVDLYNEILGLLKQWKMDQSHQAGIAYTNLGAAYGKMGKYGKAIEMQKKATAIFQKMGKNYWEYVTTSLFNTANVFVFMNHMDSAETYIRKALGTAKTGTSLEAEIVNGLAAVHMAAKRFDSAEGLFKKALETAYQASTVRTGTEFNIESNLATLYHVTGKTKLADSLFERTFRRLAEAQKPDYQLGNRLYEIYCAYLIGNKRYKEAADSLLSLNGKVLPFIRQNFAGMSEADKMDFIARLYKTFDLEYSLLSQDPDAAPAFVEHAFGNALLLKGLVLSSQAAVMRSVRNSNDTALRALFSDWLSTKQLLYKKRRPEPILRSLKTDSLQQRMDVIEALLSRRARADEFLQVYREVPVAEIKASLKLAECAIEFVRFGRPVSGKKNAIFYGAFVLGPKDSVPHFVTLCNESRLQNLMSDGKGGVSPDLYPFVSNGKATASPRSKALYQLVWKPLERYVSGAGKIYYSPAGLLHYVALNAMSNGKGRLLMDDYRLQALLNLRSLPATVGNVTVSKASLWGNMDYGEKAGVAASTSVEKRGAKGGTVATPWDKIPTAEIDAVKAILNAKGIESRVSQGAAASEALFKQTANGFNGILHISTHGFYAPDTFAVAGSGFGNAFTHNLDPMLRCGLVFSGGNRAWLRGDPLLGQEDGILTGYEISEMDLHNVNLVTLSACETGLGKVSGYEGLFGLQRAFKMAGAGKMLVSLWKVPSKKTADLMKLFYTHWTPTTSPQEALLKAQRQLRKTSDPYGWAGFVLVE